MTSSARLGTELVWSVGHNIGSYESGRCDGPFACASPYASTGFASYVQVRVRPSAPCRRCSRTQVPSWCWATVLVFVWIFPPIGCGDERGGPRRRPGVRVARLLN
jgi:hypothetical protein